MVIIGSRVRSAGAFGSADEFSDWDFQIGTSNPQLFDKASWPNSVGLVPLAYVARQGRLGSAQKISVLFAAGALDIVVIPIARLNEAVKLTNTLGKVSDSSGGFSDLAAVISSGYKIVKGTLELAQLYERIVKEVRGFRLSDQDVQDIGDSFVVDYVSTKNKIERGELLAAQRWLHIYLAETNFRLLHELRLRRGETSFPDARRLEFLLDGSVIGKFNVEARIERTSLQAAVEKCAECCRLLIAQLLEGTWAWPQLTQINSPRIAPQ